MKKILSLTLSLLALHLTPVLGQPAMSELTTFNLDFHGGPPGLLVQAIEKATGKPLNAIIPTEDAQMDLPPLKMNGVVLPQLFTALEAASRKTVMAQGIGAPGNLMPVTTPQRTGQPVPMIGAPGSLMPVTTSFGFSTAEGHVTDTSVWYFHAVRADEPGRPPVAAPEKICTFYSLSPYLDRGFTVDDITTAIQTGWKMAGVNPPPPLNYHKETGLLIVYGEPDKLKVVNDVLRTLPSANYDYWQRLNASVIQLQQQVKALQKGVSAPPTNAAPEEKSGK